MHYLELKIVLSNNKTLMKPISKSNAKELYTRSFLFLFKNLIEKFTYCSLSLFSGDGQEICKIHSIGAIVIEICISIFHKHFNTIR